MSNSRYCLLGLLLFVFVATACSEKKTTLIPEDKFVKVFVDAYLAEIAAQPYVREEKDSIINVYFDKIYEIHGVTMEEFNKTLDAMQNDPIRMDSLYSKSMELLKKMEQEIGKTN